MPSSRSHQIRHTQAKSNNGARRGSSSTGWWRYRCLPAPRRRAARPTRTTETGPYAVARTSWQGAPTVGSRGGRWPLTRDTVTKAADPVSSRPSTTCGGDNPSSPILMNKNWHPRPRPTSRTGPVLRHRVTASHHLQPPSCVSEPPSIGAHPVNARHRRLVRSGAQRHRETPDELRPRPWQTRCAKAGGFRTGTHPGSTYAPI